MKSENKERFINKLSLVLEFNERSPFFARIAEFEILRDNTGDALSILEQGVKVHPNYPTAHIIYGLALIKNGSVDKGLEQMKKGTHLIDSDETLNHYLSLIDEYLPQGEGLKSEKRFDDNVESDIDDIIDLNEENFEERILGHDHIISETLAEIYLSQDNLYEALAMFSKLAKENPDKEKYFKGKADEVRVLISKNKR